MKNEIKSAVPVPKGSGWNLFTGETLPERVFNMISANNGFQSPSASWCIGAVFYKGDLETTNDWIVTTDDGWYYKVHAEYMIWHRPKGAQPGETKFHAQAIWSNAALKRSLKSLMVTGMTTPDPGYQS